MVLTRSLAKAMVKKWVGHFRADRTSLQYDQREGRPTIALNTISREQVKKCINQDLCKIVRDITTSTKISKSRVHAILRQELNMWEVC